mmetsp:Transcript_34959/g.110439  ORF Transcript_34959/g.110439 Transcript_34959/m.110439 type:complete len:418 (-) Transcript_34959:218-1471(-)
MRVTSPAYASLGVDCLAPRAAGRATARAAAGQRQPGVPVAGGVIALPAAAMMGGFSSARPSAATVSSRAWACAPRCPWPSPARPTMPAGALARTGADVHAGALAASGRDWMARSAGEGHGHRANPLGPRGSAFYARRAELLRAAGSPFSRRAASIATAGSMLFGGRGVLASEVSNDVAGVKDGAGSQEASQGGLRPSRYTTTERIIAVGDLHGDLYQTRRALAAAGVLGEDSEGRPIWIGGKSVLVQMGDVLDRGDNEIAILALLKKLQLEAEAEGGAVYCLNGNHEGLNVAGDFRYVTAGGFYESALVAGLEQEQAAVWESQIRARVALFQPGGPLAREMAENFTVLIINDTAFAHGGLLPEHVEYGLDELNEEVSAWMRGERATREPPAIAMAGMDSVMWSRLYSHERFRDVRVR